MSLLTNLVSYYKYDENAGSAVGDTLGNANATWQGTLGSQWGTGIINSGGIFNGTNNYVNATQATQLSGSFSFSAWVNLTTVQDSNIVNSDVASFANYWGNLFIQGGTSNRFGFALYDGTNNPSINSANNTAVTGTWTHGVGVRDTSAGKIFLYLNGVLVASTVDTTTAVPVYSEFLIGAVHRATYQEFLSGKIDEVGVWSRAVTVDEISQLVNGGAGLQYPFPIAPHPSLYIGSPPKPLIKQGMILY